MRWVIPTVCTAILLGLAVQPRHAADGIPAPAADAADNAAPKPPRRTSRDEYATVLEFNRRTLVGAYDKVGRRNPKWDEPARAVLDATARSFSASGLNAMYLPEPAPTVAERLALGRKAFDAGCDDPLVLFCYGIVLEPSDRTGALALFRRAYEGLKAGGYPPVRAYTSSRRIWNSIPDGPERQAAAKSIAEARVAMLCGEVDDGGRRVLVEYVEGDIGAPAGRKAMRELVDALDARKDADPWLRDVIAGRLHIRLAWDARGSDVAVKVNEPGWEGFAENLAAARERFTRAWKAAPHLPHAPAEMIVVSMGGGEALGEDEMEWFERALDAQVDFLPAYNKIYTALLPRWGGSFEQIAEVGLACVEVGRYDTLVPWQFMTAMHAVKRDAGSYRLVFRNPRWYAAMVEVTEGYAKALAGKKAADFYKSYHAAAAWAAGNYEDAKRVLDELGDRVDPRPFKSLEADDAADAVSQVYALSGPHAAAIRDAESAAADGDNAAAAKGFAAVVATLDEKDRGRLFIETRARAAGAAVKFAAGEWVDIQPVKTLSGWKSVVGTWTLDDDGALVGAPAASGPLARQKVMVWTGAMLGVDETFEIAGSVEFDGMPGKKVGGAGAVVLSDDYDTRGYALVDADLGKVVYWFGKNPTMTPTETQKTNDFIVRFDRRTFTAEVNGKPAAEPFRLGGDRYDAGIRVGIGGVGLAKVKFTKLKLRRIETP